MEHESIPQEKNYNASTLEMQWYSTGRVAGYDSTVIEYDAALLGSVVITIGDIVLLRTDDGEKEYVLWIRNMFSKGEGAFIRGLWFFRANECAGQPLPAGANPDTDVFLSHYEDSNDLGSIVGHVDMSFPGMKPERVAPFQPHKATDLLAGEPPKLEQLRCQYSFNLRGGTFTQLKQKTLDDACRPFTGRRAQLSHIWNLNPSITLDAMFHRNNEIDSMSSTAATFSKSAAESGSSLPQQNEASTNEVLRGETSQAGGRHSLHGSRKSRKRKSSPKNALDASESTPQSLGFETPEIGNSNKLVTPKIKSTNRRGRPRSSKDASVPKSRSSPLDTKQIAATAPLAASDAMKPPSKPYSGDDDDSEIDIEEIVYPHDQLVIDNSSNNDMKADVSSDGSTLDMPNEKQSDWNTLFNSIRTTTNEMSERHTHSTQSRCEGTEVPNKDSVSHIDPSSSAISTVHSDVSTIPATVSSTASSATSFLASPSLVSTQYRVTARVGEQYQAFIPPLAIGTWDRIATVEGSRSDYQYEHRIEEPKSPQAATMSEQGSLSFIRPSVFNFDDPVRSFIRPEAIPRGGLLWTQAVAKKINKNIETIPDNATKFLSDINLNNEPLNGKTTSISTAMEPVSVDQTNSTLSTSSRSPLVTHAFSSSQMPATLESAPTGTQTKPTSLESSLNGQVSPSEPQSTTATLISASQTPINLAEPNYSTGHFATNSAQSTVTSSEIISNTMLSITSSSQSICNTEQSTTTSDQSTNRGELQDTFDDKSQIWLYSSSDGNTSNWKTLPQETVHQLSDTEMIFQMRGDIRWSNDQIIQFMKGFNIHGKLYSMIPSHMSHASVRDCIAFYYRHKQRIVTVRNDQRGLSYSRDGMVEAQEAIDLANKATEVFEQKFQAAVCTLCEDKANIESVLCDLSGLHKIAWFSATDIAHLPSCHGNAPAIGTLHRFLPPSDVLVCQNPSCGKRVGPREYKSDRALYKNRPWDRKLRFAINNPFWLCSTCCPLTAPQPTTETNRLSAVAGRDRLRRRAAMMADAERLAREWADRDGVERSKKTEKKVSRQKKQKGPDATIFQARLTIRDAVAFADHVQKVYGASHPKYIQFLRISSMYQQGVYTPSELAAEAAKLFCDNLPLLRAFILFLPPPLRFAYEVQLKRLIDARMVALLKLSMEKSHTDDTS